MKIFCKSLNQEFESVEKLHKALKENESKLISLKTAAVKFSDGLSVDLPRFESETDKGFSFVKDGFYYPVINTTNYMDSHDDVHLSGIWNKSIKEQKGKVYYLVNHKLEVGSVVAYPDDVEMMLKTLNWSDFGKDYSGETEALIFKIKLADDAHASAKAILESKRPIQNSVRMQYVKIKLAINSNDEYYKENKAVYDTHINQIANKEVAEKQGYFFAVYEAKINKEGSMVLFGSNDITPVLYNNEPPTGTQSNKNEPSLDTQKIVKSISNLKFALK